MTELTGEQRRRVTKYLPENMNTNEGHHFMTLLSELGYISPFLNELDSAEDFAKEEDCEPYEVRFSDYYDLYKIKINPETGKIIHLSIDRYRDELGEEMAFWGGHIPLELPSTVKHFQSLESMSLGSDCYLLTEELGNLPHLTNINFYGCPSHMYENIPEGLHFTFVKKIVITSGFKHMPSFLKLFSNKLEELHFADAYEPPEEEILRALQQDDLEFKQSLRKIHFSNFCLNESCENDLKLLMFEIQEQYINLREINVPNCQVESLVGISDKIKKTPSSVFYNNNLRKLNLSGNSEVLNSNYSGFLHPVKPEEKDSLLTILHRFDRISNLGLTLCERYDSDIESVLRINHAGRNFINKRVATAGDTPVINPALWPLILERAFEKSGEIYKTDRFDSPEKIDKTKSPTGVFDLVQHFWQSMYVNHPSYRRAQWWDSGNTKNDDQQMITATLNSKRKR